MASGFTLLVRRRERRHGRSVPDGGVQVRFEVTDLREVLGWALSLGADCEVLEPGGFREMMKREVAELRMKYRE